MLDADWYRRSWETCVYWTRLRGCTSISSALRAVPIKTTRTGFGGNAPSCGVPPRRPGSTGGGGLDSPPRLRPTKAGPRRGRSYSWCCFQAESGTSARETETASPLERPSPTLSGRPPGTGARRAAGRHAAQIRAPTRSTVYHPIWRGLRALPSPGFGSPRAGRDPWQPAGRATNTAPTALGLRRILTDARGHVR